MIPPFVDDVLAGNVLPEKEWANLYLDGQRIATGLAIFEPDRKAGLWMPTDGSKPNSVPCSETKLTLNCATGELLLASFLPGQTEIASYLFEVAE